MSNGTPQSFKQLIIDRVRELPDDRQLLISIFNTINLHQSNRDYFDEVNAKFLKLAAKKKDREEFFDHGAY